MGDLCHAIPTRKPNYRGGADRDNSETSPGRGLQRHRRPEAQRGRAPEKFLPADAKAGAGGETDQGRPAAQKPPAAPAEERKGENLLMSFLGGWSIRGAFLAIAVIAAVIIGTLISNAQLVMVNDQMVELRSTLSDLQDQETQLKAQYELSYDLQDIERQLLASGEMMKAQSWQIYTLELSEPDAVEYHQAWDLPQKLLSMAKEFSTAVREYF